jgi:hypothetical protein
MLCNNEVENRSQAPQSAGQCRIICAGTLCDWWINGSWLQCVDAELAYLEKNPFCRQKCRFCYSGVVGAFSLRQTGEGCLQRVMAGRGLAMVLSPQRGAEIHALA